jgi:hypothetical protein
MLTISRAASLALLLTALLIPAGSARATVMLALDLEGLVGRASHIIVGTVEGSQSRWTDDRRYIVTDTTLRVDSTVHGKAGDRVIVRRLGGSVNGIGMRVSGATVLQRGERVLLFGERMGQGALRVVGMRQGLYRLRTDARGRTTVHRNLAGIELAGKQPGGVKPLRGSLSEATPADSLEAFVERIRRTVKTCAGRADHCRPAAR